jgi:hypothetical protein
MPTTDGSKEAANRKIRPEKNAQTSTYGCDLLGGHNVRAYLAEKAILDVAWMPPIIAQVK